ncbi:MAG: glycosyltransferase family 4 protein [Thermoleophilaceae bacterium]
MSGSGGAAPGDPIRVDLLSPAFWPEVRRGSERFVRDLADGLLARGHRPRLITSHAGRPRASIEDGLPVTRVWRPPMGWLESRGFESYLTHWPLSEAVLRWGDADVAHAVFTTDALAAVRWGRATGRPTVLSFMGIPDRVGPRLRATLARRAVAGSDATIALSQAAAEAFWRQFGVETRVIYPGVDLRAFVPGDERYPQPTVFCGAAVTEPRKRVALLVRAFAIVRHERPSARLLLSRPASGVEPAGFEAPGVEFVDVDDRGTLAKTYSRSWVSALPSLGEAFGLVLVEALACGTPVVASNRDGMREVVDRADIGRLFEGDDERALARSLLEALELAEDPGIRRACRERAEDFSIERTTEAYLDLYTELLS